MMLGRANWHLLAQLSLREGWELVCLIYVSRLLHPVGTRSTSERWEKQIHFFDIQELHSPNVREFTWIAETIKLRMADLHLSYLFQANQDGVAFTAQETTTRKFDARMRKNHCSFRHEMDHDRKTRKEYEHFVRVQYQTRSE